MNLYEKLKAQAGTVRSHVEIADVAFVGLYVKRS